MPVFLVTRPAAFGGEIELVPPLKLSLGRQRHLAGLLAPDQVPADGDERFDALRPERRNDVGRPRAPVKAGEKCLLYAKRVHKVDDIDRQRRRLTIAEGLV